MLDGVGGVPESAEADDTGKAVRGPDRSVRFKPKGQAEAVVRGFSGRGLLGLSMRHRRYLIRPLMREEESVLLYAASGVGKSMVATSLALAVAGGGRLFGWTADEAPPGGFRVLLMDGEMHIDDIQERIRLLLNTIPGIDRGQALENLTVIARQHQDPDLDFPLISETQGMAFVRKAVEDTRAHLVILDNFSTLGEVADENDAASFNAITKFLLGLKASGIGTILVHHSGKDGSTYRGSSKLAATFETIVSLSVLEGRERTAEGAAFRLGFDKRRAGGPGKTVRPLVAALVHQEGGEARWEFEADDLDRLDAIREGLKAGRYKTQAEIAGDLGISPGRMSHIMQRARELGLWTERQQTGWLALGKRLRTMQKTEAPISVTEGQEDPEF